MHGILFKKGLDTTVQDPTFSHLEWQNDVDKISLHLKPNSEFNRVFVILTIVENPDSDPIQYLSRKDSLSKDFLGITEGGSPFVILKADDFLREGFFGPAFLVVIKDALFSVD